MLHSGAPRRKLFFPTLVCWRAYYKDATKKRRVVFYRSEHLNNIFTAVFQLQILYDLMHAKKSCQRFTLVRHCFPCTWRQQPRRVMYLYSRVIFQTWGVVYMNSPRREGSFLIIFRHHVNAPWTSLSEGILWSSPPTSATPFQRLHRLKSSKSKIQGTNPANQPEKTCHYSCTQTSGLPQIWQTAGTTALLLFDFFFSHTMQNRIWLVISKQRLLFFRFTIETCRETRFTKGNTHANHFICLDAGEKQQISSEAKRKKERKKEGA